jgi:hypothetical protein
MCRTPQKPKTTQFTLNANFSIQTSQSKLLNPNFSIQTSQSKLHPGANFRKPQRNLRNGMLIPTQLANFVPKN